MTIPNNAFALKFTVSPDDIDAVDHVSNVRIVKWISDAAWEHSQSLGYDLPAYQALGAWFVIRRHEIDYLSFARLGDELTIFTWPSDLQKVTAERKHVIQRADGLVITRALNLWAYVDINTGKPLRIPPAVRDSFDPMKFI